ncbi:MAG TPA: phage holin family protein [Candidatus Peribacteraceae bacterium]|nr:phage holin family protein [Candidatus Peribacteraceae bacterium]
MPAVIIMRFVLTMILVWWMSRSFSEYFVITGELQAIVVIGALLTLMNMLVRPFLDLIAFPLKLFGLLLAVIVVNGLFLYLTTQITDNMDPTIVTLQITGGIWGWLVVSFIIGFGNWVTNKIAK